MNFTLKNIVHTDLNRVQFRKTYTKEEVSELDEKVKHLFQGTLSLPINFDDLDKLDLKFNIKSKDRNIQIIVQSKDGSKFSKKFSLNNSELSQNQKIELFNLKNFIKHDSANKKGFIAHNKSIIEEINEIINNINHQANLKKSFEKLKSYNPLDIPLHELLKIKPTANNNKQLAELWSFILKISFLKGNLTNLISDKNNPIVNDQIRYAKKYLDTFLLIPSELFDVDFFSSEIQEATNINLIDEELENLQACSNIINFLKLNSDLLDPKSCFDKSNYLIRKIKLDPDNLALIEELRFFSPLEISYHELSQIQTTSKNCTALAEIWQTYLAELFSKGNFINLKIALPPEIYTHVPFAQNYLLARNYVPKKLLEVYIKTINSNKLLTQTKQNLSSFILYLDNILNLRKIEKYLKRANLTEFEICFQNPKPKQFKSIFLKKILPNINSTIDKFESRDSIAKFQVLIKKSDELIESFISSSLEDLVSKKSKIYFNQKRLRKIILKKLTHNFFTSHNFNKYQENQFTKLFYSFKNKRANIDFSEINEIIYSNINISNIRKSKKSSRNFTSDECADLMQITKFLNKINNSFAVSLKEKKDFFSVLGKIKDNSHIHNQIRLYLRKSQVDENMTSIYQFFPKFLHKFINYFFPNSDLILRKSFELTNGISKDAVLFVDDYINLIKYTDKLSEIKYLNKKISILTKKYLSNSLIKKSERVSLKEIGLLGRFEKRGNFLNQLDIIGLFNNNSYIKKSTNNNARIKELFDLFTTYKNVNKNIRKIECLLNSIINQHYKDGSVFLHHMRKKSMWIGRSVGLENILTGLISNNFIHAGKLFHNNIGNLTTSEISHAFSQKNFRFYDLLISNIYFINVSNLINSHTTKNLLETVYGKKWVYKINNKFQKIERDLQLKINSNEICIDNDTIKRFSAGLSDFPLLARWILGFSVPTHINEDGNLMEIHKEFFGNSSMKPKQICSEFASRMTVATMIELNKQLTKDLLKSKKNKWNPQNVLKKVKSLGKKSVPKEIKEYLSTSNKKDFLLEKKVKMFLKKYKYTNEDIELILRLRNEEIFDLPFSETENFETIHPGRMINLLKKKKCIEEVKPPEALQQLFVL